MLSKGLEVEVYTGTFEGDIVGFSDRIVASMQGFVREPDTRNVEYTTTPSHGYHDLLQQLLEPRVKLRHFLKTIGEYTILPGSTLSLGDSKCFYRSDPGNPYHDYIQNTYGTAIVTASAHINIGIDNTELLMQACNLIRCEACLYLALSASSPFRDDQPTGYHSTRWEQFPKTHNTMPLFDDHQHFIAWVQEQLQLKTMQNVRHLWTSVRPNGKRRPYELDRLELRICDLISDPLTLLAVTALLEARVLWFMQNPSTVFDSSSLTREQLLDATVRNDASASRSSLDAEIIDWRDGSKTTTRDRLAEIYEEVLPFAQREGFVEYLQPVNTIIEEGNEALRWLGEYQQHGNIRQIISQAAAQMYQREQQLLASVQG